MVGKWNIPSDGPASTMATPLDNPERIAIPYQHLCAVLTNANVEIPRTQRCLVGGGNFVEDVFPQDPAGVEDASVIKTTSLTVSFSRTRTRQKEMAFPQVSVQICKSVG